MEKNAKKGWYIWMLFLSMFGTGIISSCQDDLVEEDEMQLEDCSLLGQAKAWYMGQKEGQEVMLSSLSRSREGNGLLFYTEPSWKYYCESENLTYKSIDVSLTDRIALDFVLEENKEQYERTGIHKYRRSYSRLVILTSKLTGKKTGFIMTLLPSIKYIEDENCRIGRNLYLHRDENYDGMIFYHDLEGRFVNGWRYEQGKVTGRIQKLDVNLVECAANEEVFNYEMMPMTYSVTGYTASRLGGEGGGNVDIDGGELEEVVVPGKKPGGNTGGSGIIIIIGGGTGGYDGDHDSGMGSGGSSGGPGGSGTSSEIPKIKIDTSLTNNSRINKIFEALGKEVWSYFNKLLSRYEGQINKMDLLIKLDNTPFETDANRNLNGLCHAEYINGKLNTVIYINVDRMATHPALDIARTFLHESLHAYIFGLNYVENPSYGQTSLDESWNDYVRNSSQHEEIATRELNNLAEELERLHKQTTDYKNVWKYFDTDTDADRKLFYKGLSWGGLKQTDAYNKLDATEKGKMLEMVNRILPMCGQDWE